MKEIIITTIIVVLIGLLFLAAMYFNNDGIAANDYLAGLCILGIVPLGLILLKE